MRSCHGRLGWDHVRFLRSLALTGKRLRYPRASSIPSAVFLLIEGIQ
jgi:hypothetical protein